MGHEVFVMSAGCRYKLHKRPTFLVSYSHIYLTILYLVNNIFLNFNVEVIIGFFFLNRSFLPEFELFLMGRGGQVVSGPNLSQELVFSFRILRALLSCGKLCWPQKSSLTVKKKNNQQITFT